MKNEKKLKRLTRRTERRQVKLSEEGPKEIIHRKQNSQGNDGIDEEIISPIFYSPPQRNFLSFSCSQES